MGLLPRMERSTTTDATEATTAEPIRAAFMSTMISSRAKMTAATGVLHAADRAAAAATGIRLCARAGDRLNHLPMEDARLAPICTEGPSLPMEWPDPMQSTPVRNLPKATRPGMLPWLRW